jgi:hypothetical protein
VKGVVWWGPVSWPTRDRDYDDVVVVIMDEDFIVTEGLTLSRELVEKLSPQRAHVSGRVITVTRALRADPRVEHLDLSAAGVALE